MYNFKYYVYESKKSKIGIHIWLCFRKPLHFSQKTLALSFILVRKIDFNLWGLNSDEYFITRQFNDLFYEITFKRNLVENTLVMEKYQISKSSQDSNEINENYNTELDKIYRIHVDILKNMFSIDHYMEQ